MNYLQNFSYYEYFGNKCDCGMSSTHNHVLTCDKPGAVTYYKRNGAPVNLCNDCATPRLSSDGWSQAFIEREAA